MMAPVEMEGQEAVLRADVRLAARVLLLQASALPPLVSWQNCMHWLGLCRTKTAELARQRRCQRLKDL